MKMIIAKKIIYLFLAVATIVSGPYLVVATSAASLTDAQVQHIRGNCVSIKNTLNQLHASDALLRVNMGQIYESMLTKVMNRFNDRLASNGLDNSNLVKASGNFSQSLDNFRKDYITYEGQLASVINIDCFNQPSQFYDAILSARTKRNQVHTDVIKLMQFKNQYSTALGQFIKDYQKSNGSNQ